MNEDLVEKLVNDIRRYQPRIGGKKLYHLLGNDLHKIDPGLGRDKFFDILGKKKLLVKRRKKYVYTTNSFHWLRVYKNALKNKLLAAPNQGLVERYNLFADQPWICISVFDYRMLIAER